MWYREGFKVCRLLQKKKIADCAKAVGVSPSTYARWESGKATPTIDHLIKACNFLGIDINELTSRPEDK